MSELLPCPFCGDEAFVRIDISLVQTQSRYRVGCDKDPSCHGWFGHSRYYATEAEAIAAWNTRTDYHGYEQAAIEAWESIKAWNTHAERTCEMYRDEHGTWHCKACESGADADTGSDGTLDAWHDSWAPNYCPNCGAKVKVVDK